MRPRILVTILLTALFALLSGCGGTKNCPVCGTTTAGGYTVIDIMPVPEHNPTGEPGGPFNSFDISLADSVNHRFFVSDRIGLDVAVFDTQQDVAVNFFAGANGVAGGGINASACITDNPAAPTLFIPPLVTGFGNWTRFGCRTLAFHIPGFGANGLFGGFPGAQCCAARANGVNPLSAPDGEALSPDNKTLFVANGSASVVAFDLSTTTFSTSATSLPPGPTVIAAFATGVSPDYDGPNGVAPCIASANGRAFSDGSCGDLRADEMSIGVVNGTTLLLIANGDPGFPFITIADVTNIVAPTGVYTADHCLPVAAQTPYGLPVVTTAGVVGQGSIAPAAGPINPPTCILGQIYYDGAVQNDSTVVIDDGGLNGPAGFICPDPSSTVLSGMTGHGAGVNILGPDRPCHHGPMLDPAGSFCASQAPPAAGCFGAVAIAGIGGSAFNPNSGRFLVTNSNASATDLTYGTVDVINPNLGSPNGPFVENSFRMPNCMPTSVVQGPGNNFLVGCGDHDGEAFPPNEYVIDGTTGKFLATITNVGGVDEIWYNPGDNRYYLAARDMPTGAVMGVIDAKTNQWLANVATNSNSHSIAVDSTNNHAFVPLQAGTICTTQSANGCVGVYAEQ
ncbi:MAG: hypothetical protein JWQ87_1235 [Candidatus Sulfotelmatobacter sp.]|nr:hypothetical protein [Candidatus Sulfotelmatobacter sp.]